MKLIEGFVVLLTLGKCRVGIGIAIAIYSFSNITYNKQLWLRVVYFVAQGKVRAVFAFPVSAQNARVSRKRNWLKIFRK